MKTVSFGAIYLNSKDKHISNQPLATELAEHFKQEGIEAQATSVADFRKTASFKRKFAVWKLKPDSYIVTTGQDLKPKAPKPTEAESKKEQDSYLRFMLEKYRAALEKSLEVNGKLIETYRDIIALERGFIDKLQGLSGKLKTAASSLDDLRL